MRGLADVQQQCLLAATAQNIRKIALPLGNSSPNMRTSALPTLLLAYIDQLRCYQSPQTNHSFQN
jgi:hypothetical protein